MGVPHAEPRNSGDRDGGHLLVLRPCVDYISSAKAFAIQKLYFLQGFEAGAAQPELTDHPFAV